jgi:hypothetical protein
VISRRPHLRLIPSADGAASSHKLAIQKKDLEIASIQVELTGRTINKFGG